MLTAVSLSDAAAGKSIHDFGPQPVWSYGRVGREGYASGKGGKTECLSPRLWRL